MLENDNMLEINKIIVKEVNFHLLGLKKKLKVNRYVNICQSYASVELDVKIKLQITYNSKN